MKLFCCAAAIVLSACASSGARDDDAATPAANSTAMVEQQTAAIDARVSEMQKSMTELLERLDVMNSRLARLEAGGVVAEAPQQTQPAAPSARIEQPHVMPVNPAPAAPASSALVGAQLADHYRNALMLYGRGKFDDARRAFQQVFDQDPAGDLADNSLYWIGETYFAAGNYSEAMKYYKRVTVEFAEQNKAPDALFKIALSFEKTSDLGMAKQTLEEVIRRYPYSSAAASSKLELKRIKY